MVAPGNVEDVASEVWLSVTRGLCSFEGGEQDFRGWIFTIARRRAIDWGRRRGRQPPVASLTGIDIVDPAAASSALVEANTALEAALAMLQRLTVDQAEVVALRVIVGMTVSETAAIVNKTEGAVRVLCHRGLRTLAQQIDAEPLAQGVTG